MAGPHAHFAHALDMSASTLYPLTTAHAFIILQDASELTRTMSLFRRRIVGDVGIHPAHIYLVKALRGWRSTCSQQLCTKYILSL